MKQQAAAAVFIGVDTPFEIKQFDITPTPKGMARIELIASGICGTDLHIYRGKLAVNTPSIIGHEFIGKIIDVDEAEAQKYKLKIGDNVAVYIAIACKECVLCKAGDDANCINLAVSNGNDIHVAPYLWGGYTEVNYSPLEQLIKIPEAINPVAASVFACPGPTAIHAFQIAERAGVDIAAEIQTAVVQGLGPVGCFAVLYLKHKYKIKNVIALTAGNNLERERLALQLGADIVYNISRQNIQEITEQIMQTGNGIGADLVFEASGTPIAFAQGLSMLRNRGVYLVPGQYSNSGKVEVPPQVITFKALRILGSSQYSVCDVQHYFSFLQDNPQFEKLILQLQTGYKIEEINKAFDVAKTGANIKTLLVK